MPQKFVRVRLENGTEKSVPEVVAKTSGYKPLDKPTHGRDGRLLPEKPRVPLGTESAAKSRKSPAVKSAADESQED